MDTNAINSMQLELARLRSTGADEAVIEQHIQESARSIREMALASGKVVSVENIESYLRNCRENECH